MITSKEIKTNWKEKDGWYQNPETKLWVTLGDRVTPPQVISKYICQIFPIKDSPTQIKLGCEIHTIEDWDKHSKAYARKDNDLEWWEQEGQYIYQYLKGAAQRYDSVSHKG